MQLNVAPTCLICGVAIEHPLVCRTCGEPCEPVVTDIQPLDSPDSLLSVLDVVSSCHHADVDMRSTCGPEHHEELIRQMMDSFGGVKKVIDSTTGKAYAVPTRDIIEKGLRWADLPSYPEWKELR